MKTFLIAALIGCVLLLWYQKPSMKDHWQLGYEQGRKDALKTNPVSEDLELVCAGLWVGKQISKEQK
jgi:hypothetical protein